MSEDTEDLQIVTESGPFAIVPVWVLQVGLSGAELATYVAMRSFADRRGEGWPKVKSIAERAGVNPRTAEKAIARFRELGMLTSVQRRRPDGSISGCTYYLRDVPLTGRQVVAVAGGSPVPPVRTAGTPPGEMDGAPPAVRREQEQTTGTDQWEQTNQERARASDVGTTALVLAEQLINTHRGRIAIPPDRFAMLLIVPLRNGVTPQTLCRAVGRILTEGQRLASWTLADYVIKCSGTGQLGFMQ